MSKSSFLPTLEAIVSLKCLSTYFKTHARYLNHSLGYARVKSRLLQVSLLTAAVVVLNSNSSIASLQDPSGMCTTLAPEFFENLLRPDVKDLICRAESETSSSLPALTSLVKGVLRQLSYLVIREPFCKGTLPLQAASKSCRMHPTLYKGVCLLGTCTETISKANCLSMPQLTKQVSTIIQSNHESPLEHSPAHTQAFCPCPHRPAGRLPLEN